MEATYSKVLNIVQSEKAVSDGLFFDLMYANNDGSNSFAPQHQYTFIRKSGNEVILVAVNFSGQPVECGIRLPQHAFEYLGLPEKAVKVSDLLTDEQTEWDLQADNTVKVTLNPYSGRIYKFKV